MKVLHRICLHDYTLTDEEGTSFTLKRGQQYVTSAEPKEGTLVVFSQYWVTVPADLFAGPLTLDGKQP